MCVGQERVASQTIRRWGTCCCLLKNKLPKYVVYAIYIWNEVSALLLIYYAHILYVGGELLTSSSAGDLSACGHRASTCSITCPTYGRTLVYTYVRTRPRKSTWSVVGWRRRHDDDNEKSKGIRLFRTNCAHLSERKLLGIST